MKQYPAIDVRTGTSDFILAIVDDFGPTAVEERDATVRVFFSTADDRDEAQRALAPRFEVVAVDISDEDWARRSQDNLKPITVGRITVAPPWASSVHDPSAISHEPSAMVEIVILPSMGFGTGHHVTTRLCLAALQTIDLTDRVLLDVGTGSGVLAIAAAHLGAAQALGIDYDPDAIRSARENLDLVTLIFFNRTYEILKGEFQYVGAGHAGQKALDMMEIGRPTLDWVGLSQAQGVSASRADSLDTLADQLRSALGRRGPHLIEVMV